MKNVDENILIDYIDGTLAESDVALVREWLAASPENEKQFEQMYFLSQATKRLQVMRAVDTEKALRQFKLRIRQNTDKQKKGLGLRRVLGVVRQIAAVLFVPVFMLSAYLLIERVQRGGGRMLTMQTNSGVVSSFDLPDGSKVWLNSNSELRYPSDFQGDTRSVELIGQGYFEVTKNQDKPFIVKTDNGYSVEVLGTSFNVSAYKDEDVIETTLVEGSVRLGIMTASGKKVTQMLRPKEKAEFQKKEGKLEVFDVNTEYDTAWKQREIIFRNHSMDKVLRTLSRYYHVEFDVKDNTILNSIITARFKNEQLPQVLEYLRLASGIQYVIHKPTVRGGVERTSVVEISK